MPDATAIAALSEFALLPVPGAVFELDGRIVALNRAAEALVGRRSADVLGRMAWELAPGVEYIWQDVLAVARKDGT